MNIVQFPGTRREDPPDVRPDPEMAQLYELRRIELETAQLLLAQARAEVHRFNLMWAWYCFKRVLFWAFILWGVLHFMGTAKAEPWTQRSYYDGNGRFAGSSSSNSRTSSFYDHQGRFSGSAVRYGNRENFYDKSGHLVSTSIGPRR